MSFYVDRTGSLVYKRPLSVVMAGLMQGWALLFVVALIILVACVVSGDWRPMIGVAAIGAFNGWATWYEWRHGKGLA